MPDAARARREEGGHGDDPFYHEDTEDTEFGFKNQEFRGFCDLAPRGKRYLVTFVRDGAFWPFWTAAIAPRRGMKA
jgi:hypothetical protein